MTRLIMGAPEVDSVATKSLRGLDLKARNRGDISSAMLSAGYYARKLGHPMYGYSGNSYGSRVWRVSDKPSEYLNPINNTGGYVFSVTPELTVARHEVKRPEGLEPNASPKLEWVKGDGVDSDGHNLTWWKNKVAKWKSQWDRPTVFIRVTTWDRAGQRDKSRCGEFDAGDLKGAKEFAREATLAGGSSQIDARIDIPHQNGVTFSIGEWRNPASNGYYVWSVDRESYVPVARNGPFENPDDAIALAKRKAASGQTYDEVVTFGGDPEACDFSIWRSFKAWSGEVHYTTDLPKVAGRLREYR